MIPWRQIAELPDELKDGRQVLCWIDGYDAQTCTWGSYYRGTEVVEGWQDKESGLGYREVTHFAEITPP